MCVFRMCFVYSCKCMCVYPSLNSVRKEITLFKLRYLLSFHHHIKVVDDGKFTIYWVLLITTFQSTEAFDPVH